MGKSKKSIRASIFFSHMVIIIVFVILTSIFFRISLNIYMRRQIRTQMISAGELIKKTIDAGSVNSEDEENKNTIQAFLKMEKILKHTQSFLDLNYAIIDKTGTVIYPKSKSEYQYNLVNDIIDSIPERKFNNFINKKVIRYCSVNKKQYSIIAYPFDKINNKNSKMLLLYADMDKSRNIMFIVNVMLIVILIITAIIGIVVSSMVAKKISKPITDLSDYAKKIGERNYDVKKITTYENEEFNQLYNTMEEMVEKLSEYDSLTEKFFQNASHELRTPLMSIQGYAEAIKYGVMEDKKSAIDIIIEESKRLTSIVEGLLYLSKIDSSQDAIKFQDLDIGILLKNAIERVNGIAVKENKIIKIYYLEQSVIIKGDEEKLSTAVINVISNCIRYAHREINIKFKRNESKVLVIIEDDGSGFQENELKNVFDRFFKGKGGKHGLGLAIAKSIIVKHGGSIEAANNMDKKGACFQIILPI